MTSHELQFLNCNSAELLNVAPGIRDFLNEAYEGDFDDVDFENALGGLRFIGLKSGKTIAHASVVERSISLDGTRWFVAYIEAVAVASDFRRQGIGRQLVQQVTDFCFSNYEVAMLSTGEHGFYEQLGWVRLEVESFVETRDGLVRTEDDDDCLMLLSKRLELGHARRAVAHDRAHSAW